MRFKFYWPILTSISINSIIIYLFLANCELNVNNVTMTLSQLFEVHYNIFYFSLKRAEHQIEDLKSTEPMLRKELEICLEVSF